MSVASRMPSASDMDRHRGAGHSRLITVVLSLVLVASFADGDRGVQLRGYKAKCAGRVELSNGTRVCSDKWSQREADVVCTELMCGKAVGFGRSSFGFGSGSVWLKSVNCRGGEITLSGCERWEFGSACPQKDAGVVCFGGISRPEVSVLPSAEVSWGGRINISCAMTDKIHHLTRGTFTITKSSVVLKSGVSNISISPRVTFEDEGQYECCYGREQRLNLCRLVNFIVTVDLQAPNISVSSPDEWHGALGGIQVTRGYRFVVVCSTSPNYPHGRFLLHLPGSNSSLTEPAVNHSASFHFPESQSEHQGEYHCVHQVTGAGRTYTSPPSAGVQVTVKEPLLPIILPVGGVSLLLLVFIGVYFCHRRRRQVIVTEPAPATPSPITMNQYTEDDDEEEEADYVNVAPEGDKEEENDQSDDEPDYENVESYDHNTPDIYGGDESIYQNC